MFDLNLTINTNVDDANNCDGWSGETSAANGEGESSSSNDDTYSASGGAGAFTFSFDAANHGLSFDQGLTSTESALVTRDLFPVSRFNESCRNEAAAGGDHGRSEMSMPQVVVQQELPQVQAVQARKSRRGPRSRSSQYRGVTFYRRTGRWESHIWDCGKQVYLGGFDTALAAARAYDRAAIKFRGVEADINFNLSDYDDMKPVMNLPKDEFVQLLRRQSTGFSRGSSKYRGGVALQKCGRWEARTGEFPGKKYDKAAMVCNGNDTVTSFEPSRYNGETTSQLCNGGSQHDLNLNLGMSASSPNKSGSLDSLKLHHDAQTSRTLMFMQLHAGSSASNAMSNLPLEGVPVASKHPILGSGVDLKFVSHNEERGRSGNISQLEMANLAWRMNGHDQTTSATAASSGFSSQAPSGSASPVPFDFSSHANTLACYSWMKPYLPPS